MSDDDMPMPIRTRPDDLHDLAGALEVTEARQHAIDLTHRRCMTEHSLRLRRDSASLGDVLRMLTYLRDQGAPDTADITARFGYQGGAGVGVRWSTDPNESETP